MLHAFSMCCTFGMIRRFHFLVTESAERDTRVDRRAAGIVHRFRKCIRVSAREAAAPRWLVEMTRPALE